MKIEMKGETVSDKDKALALKVVREIDAAFESSERLRLGKWVLPDEREQTIASYIASALATVRRETFKDAADLVPSNWLDSLLSGSVKVVGNHPYSGTDIERLLNALRERIRGADLE